MIDCRLIPLTQGKVALVDEEDYELVSQFKWHANLCHERIQGKSVYYARGMVRVGGCRRRVYLHRFVMNAPKGTQVDHVNNDHTLDCRKNNLRVSTQSQNMGNQRSRLNTSSRYKGVSLHKLTGKWDARIKLCGKQAYLGLYTTEDDAARAYNAAATLHFGEFALLNIIPPTP
jgi:hypothetical protein